MKSADLSSWKCRWFLTWLLCFKGTVTHLEKYKCFTFPFCQNHKWTECICIILSAGDSFRHVSVPGDHDTFVSLLVCRPCGSRHTTSWSRGQLRLAIATGMWSKSFTWAWTRWRTPSPNAGSTWPARSSWSTAWMSCGAPPSAPLLRMTMPSEPKHCPTPAHLALQEQFFFFLKLQRLKCCISAVCSLWMPLLLSFLQRCLQLFVPRATSPDRPHVPSKQYSALWSLQYSQRLF